MALLSLLMTHRILHVACNGDLERPQLPSENFLGSFVVIGSG